MKTPVTINGITATVEELTGSRDGSVQSIQLLIEFRTFNVLFQDLPANERTDFKFPSPYAFVQQIVPYGAQSPWNAFALAARYSIQEQRSPISFIVRVDYIASTSIAPPDGWLMSLRGASQTKNQQDTFVLFDGDTELPSKLIGPLKYVEAPDGEPNANGVFQAVFSKVKKDGSVVFEPVRLIPTRERANITGRNVTVPGFSLTLSRQILAFPASLLPALAKFYQRVNEEPFEGAPPGHVIFEDIAIDQIPISSLGTGQTQRFTNRNIRRVGDPVRNGGGMALPLNISISFYYSSDRLEPLVLKHIYKKDGAEIAIEFTGTDLSQSGFTLPHGTRLEGHSVVEDFRGIRTANFQDLFKIIAENSGAL